MKVVLLENVDKVGKKFEVKEVKDGFARNFLIPQGLAKVATKEALKWAAIQAEILAKEAEGELKKVQEIASQMDGLEVPVSVKVGEKEQLFEKVTSQKIAEKLSEMGYQIKKDQVELEKPIEMAGEYSVKIKFDHNLETEVSVIVTEEK